MVRRLNIDGDGQGDLAGHGGEHRAVFVYQIDTYHYWQDRLGRNDFAHGQFGENFTVDGLADSEVCIGDRYRVGGAVFEVTQPRVTCYRVGIRMNEPQMPALLVAHGRPGFYFRVPQEGEVEAGDEIVKIAAGLEQALARRRRRHAACRPVQQADAEPRLQAPDRLAQRRLRYTQPDRGRVKLRSSATAISAARSSMWSPFIHKSFSTY